MNHSPLERFILLSIIKMSFPSCAGCSSPLQGLNGTNGLPGPDGVNTYQFIIPYNSGTAQTLPINFSSGLIMGFGNAGLMTFPALTNVSSFTTAPNPELSFVFPFERTIVLNSMSISFASLSSIGFVGTSPHLIGQLYLAPASTNTFNIIPNMFVSFNLDGIVLNGIAYTASASPNITQTINPGDRLALVFYVNVQGTGALSGYFSASINVTVNI